MRGGSNHRTSPKRHHLVPGHLGHRLTTSYMRSIPFVLRLVSFSGISTKLLQRVFPVRTFCLGLERGYSAWACARCSLGKRPVCSFPRDGNGAHAYLVLSDGSTKEPRLRLERGCDCWPHHTETQHKRVFAERQTPAITDQYLRIVIGRRNNPLDVFLGSGYSGNDVVRGSGNGKFPCIFVLDDKNQYLYLFWGFRLGLTPKRFLG